MTHTFGFLSPHGLATCVALAVVTACSPSQSGNASDTPVGGMPTPTGAWLDATLSAWNNVDLDLPAPPVIEEPGVYAPNGRCYRDDLPVLKTAVDSAVAAKGWTLVNTTEQFGDISVVTAASGADGMCRPFSYQAFVFVDGIYAGTLAPQVMDSRTDGSLISIKKGSSPDELIASFNRYSEADPLCCASRTSTVFYQVQRDEDNPIVIATDVQTEVNEQANPEANP